MPAQHLSPPAITVFIHTSAPIVREDDGGSHGTTPQERLSQRVRADSPYAYTDRDSAVRGAQLALPAAEDPEDLIQELAIALGSTPSGLAAGGYPDWAGSTAFLVEARFTDIEIVATEHSDARSLLQFDGSVIDAVWIPRPPWVEKGNTLRFVTKRDLSERIEILDQIVVAPIARPLTEAGPDPESQADADLI